MTTISPSLGGLARSRVSGIALAVLVALSHPARIGSADNPASSTATGGVPDTQALQPLAAAPIRFRDVAQQVGLSSVPSTSTIRRYLLETMGGGGIALFDCDNDDRLDIVLVNDSTIDQLHSGGVPMVTLYHQEGPPGTLRFTDVTVSAGLTTRGWGMAVAVADFDGDGLPDLYVSGYDGGVLYHNRGACTFEDVTAKAGVAVRGFSTGAAWADYDRDGHADLFVTRYCKVDLDNLPPPNPRAEGVLSVILEYPDIMEGESDYLFRNRGDGTFEDVSEKAGLDDPDKLRGMGVTWSDYDNDGWPDLFVANDACRNQLYHNLRNGTFEEIGIPSGVGLGIDGVVRGNMAADFGDYDRDGRLDLVVTKYSRQAASLFHNDGDDLFTDVAGKAQIAIPTLAPVKWGVGFGDFDNDGWPDIFIANGNFTTLIDTLGLKEKYRQPVQLFHNSKGQDFEEIAEGAGINDGPLLSRRGTAFGDVNNDGRLDVVVFNVAGPPSLFVNETRNDNHRVQFRLIGAKGHRSSLGARVTVSGSQLTQIDEVRGGSSYNSTNDTRLHFGLGADAIIRRVEVQWPDGSQQVFQDVAADALYDVRNDREGIKKKLALPPPDR